MTGEARGIFITFEGGDGAGKSTQAQLLAEWFESRGREVVKTREPGGTELGVRLREILLHGVGDANISPRAEALLYAADRAQHIAEVVVPALERGAVVVQDRYIDSSVAYQGAGRALAAGDVRALSQWATGGEWAAGGHWPQLTVLIDVSPETAAARRASAGQSADRLESEAAEFHNRVRSGFLALAEAEPERFIVLHAEASVAELHEQIVKRVETMLGAA